MIDSSPTRDQLMKIPDLNGFAVNQLAGLEFYAAGASIPPQFNATDDGCGTLLLWTRER